MGYIIHILELQPLNRHTSNTSGRYESFTFDVPIQEVGALINKNWYLAKAQPVETNHVDFCHPSGCVFISVILSVWLCHNI